MKNTNNLWVLETRVNEDEGYQFGHSGWFETFTNDLGRLYRALRHDYGKPTKMYIDKTDGTSVQVGWVFTKREKYDDCAKRFKQSVWVSVSLGNPEAKGHASSPWETRNV